MKVTAQVSHQERRWISDPLYWKARFQPSFEKLRGTQFREGSLYSTLRIFVPVPVMVGVWLSVVHATLTAQSGSLLARSITVRHLLLAAGVLALWHGWLSLSLFSRHSNRRDFTAEVLRLSTASVVCGLPLLFSNVTRGLYGQGVLLAGAVTFGLWGASLLLLALFLAAAALSPRLLQSRAAILVGTGRRADVMRSRLKSHYSPFHLYGCIDEEYLGKDAAGENYLGTIDRLADLLKDHPIEIVLIALPIKSKYDDIHRVVQICEKIGVDSHYMGDLFETSLAHLQVNTRQPHHVSVWSTLRPDPKQHLKRLLDIFGASLLLVLVSPIMLAAAIAVRLGSPGPIFFVQQRYGRHRKRFPMFKFRSMVVDAEQRQHALEAMNEAQGPVFKLKSDPRITRTGAFLRRTSIDELPQLFNILRGEMSLVGPRPLPLRDVSNFQESWLLRRFSVRPGLTCIWQVQGRSNTTFDEWIRQDLSYIDGWSLTLDLKILVMTIPAVLRGSGAV